MWSTLLRGPIYWHFWGAHFYYFSKYPADGQVVDKIIELVGKLEVVVCKSAIMVGKIVVMAHE